MCQNTPMRLIPSALILPLALASLCACSEEPRPLDPILGTVTFGEKERTKASKVYASLCASCHGASGRGDGADGTTKRNPPRSFHDQDWLATIDDEQIAQTIVFGGEAVGLSEDMQAFPELLRTPAVLAALVAHLRSFAQE